MVIVLCLYGDMVVNLISLTFCTLKAIVNLRLFFLLLVTGYLAETPEEYATTMHHILTHPESHVGMRVRARQSATRYSDEIFSEKFVKELNSVEID